MAAPPFDALYGIEIEAASADGARGRVFLEQAKAKEAEENERIARLLSDEAERKAKRDARYAARKARAGRH